jgi:uroporphyrinogen III methyltransferase/synthase
VHNFLQAAGRNALQGVQVASIGPVTSRTARELGIQVTVQAAEFTIDGLVGAIIGQASAGPAGLPGVS